MRGFVEIYRTESDTEARMILDVLLWPAGIDAVIHDRRGRALPAPAAAPGALHIAVPAHRAADAHRLLAAATHDGLLHEGAPSP